MTKTNKDQVFSLFSQGVAMSEIAKILSISRQRVFQILNEEETEKQKEEKNKKEEIKQEMIRLKNNGYTYQQIATELNVSIAWVSNVLREFSKKKGTRTSQQLGRFMACCCCGSRWVEKIKETPSTNCPICFSNCKEIQKIYDKKTLETLEEYAQKFYE